MKKTERKKGFYWVRVWGSTRYEPAKWSPGFGWRLLGSEYYHDLSTAAIDERPIKRRLKGRN